MLHKKVLMRASSRLPKGHLISEQICEDIDFPKLQRKYCYDFCPESFYRLGHKS